LRTEEALQRLDGSITPAKAHRKELPPGRGYLVKPGQLGVVQLAIVSDRAQSDTGVDSAQHQLAAALDLQIAEIAALWPEPFEYPESQPAAHNATTDPPAADDAVHQPAASMLPVPPDRTADDSLLFNLQLQVQFIVACMLAGDEEQSTTDQQFTGKDLTRMMAAWEDSVALADVLRNLASRYFDAHYSDLTTEELVEQLTGTIKDLLHSATDAPMADSQ
jgi:hypothetical protein